MKYNEVNIGDVVKIHDWSFSVNPKTLKMDLSYYPYVRTAEPYTILNKGRFFAPTNKFTGKRRFNNLHIKSIRDGHEYYIKSDFVDKIKKNNIK